MKKAILLCVLLFVTISNSQRIRTDFIKIKNPIERTDFSNGYERIPLMQTNGKIKGFIHSDSLVLKSDLKDIPKYQAGENINIDNSDPAKPIINSDINRYTLGFKDYDYLEGVSVNSMVKGKGRVSMTNKSTNIVGVGGTYFNTYDNTFSIGNMVELTVFTDSGVYGVFINNIIDNENMVIASVYDYQSNNYVPNWTAPTGVYDYYSGSFAIGSNLGSFAIGSNTNATGFNSFAGGGKSRALDAYAFAFGYGAQAIQSGTIAMGFNSKATAQNSVSIGQDNTSSGGASFSTNYKNFSIGEHSFSANNQNTAHSFSETVFGSFSTNYTPNSSLYWNANDRLFNIGNGNSDINRSDAFTILKNGTITAPSLDVSEITDPKSLITKEYLESKVKNYQAGSNITIDNTDPKNPIINSTVGSNDSNTDSFVPYNGATQNVNLGVKHLNFRQDYNGSGYSSSRLRDQDLELYYIDDLHRYRSTLQFSEFIMEDLDYTTGSTKENAKVTSDGFFSTSFNLDNGSENYFSKLNPHGLIINNNKLSLSSSLNDRELTFSQENKAKVYLQPTFRNQVNSADITLLKLPAKSGELALLNDIPTYQAGTGIAIDNTNPNQPIINVTSGSSSNTNLSYTASETQGEIVSSDGTNAIIPIASKTYSGLQKANFYEELDFTPTIPDDPYNVTGSRGKVVRVGNMVHFYLKIIVTQQGESDIFGIEGLPFPYYSFFNATILSNIRIPGSNFEKERINNLRTSISNNEGKAVIYLSEQDLEGRTITVNDLVFRNDSLNAPYLEINGTYITNVYTP